MKPKQKSSAVAWLPIAAGGSPARAGGATSQTISEDGSLVIPLDEVSATARFYPVTVDGTEMEILAVRDSAGNVRTAFNTCQICYGSGRGYYVQDGDVLVCQNCGNRFTVDQMEIESGGCNPWPIFPEDKTVTDDAVSISYEYLREATQIFANWKTPWPRLRQPEQQKRPEGNPSGRFVRHVQGRTRTEIAYSAQSLAPGSRASSSTSKLELWPGLTVSGRAGFPVPR